MLTRKPRKGQVLSYDNPHDKEQDPRLCRVAEMDSPSKRIMRIWYEDTGKEDLIIYGKPGDWNAYLSEV